MNTVFLMDYVGKLNKITSVNPLEAFTSTEPLLDNPMLLHGILKRYDTGIKMEYKM
jgi:hypothetical protein